MRYTALIEKYLLGELKGYPLSDFISQIKKNPELKKELHIYQSILKFITDNELNNRKILNILMKFELDIQVMKDIAKYSKSDQCSDQEGDLSLKIRQAKNQQKSRDNQND